MIAPNTPLIALPVPTEKQLEKLKTCDSSVRVRALVEQAIMRKTLEALVEAGYCVTVNDGEDDVFQRGGPDDIEPMLAVCFTTDDEVLYVHEAALGAKPFGWIKFIYGNTGWDVISDFTTNLQEVLKPVEEYSEQMSGWF